MFYEIRPETELLGDPPLLDIVSASEFLSFAVRVGLPSKSLVRDTLKIESVGILGVDSSKPPYTISCFSCIHEQCLKRCMLSKEAH